MIKDLLGVLRTKRRQSKVPTHHKIALTLVVGGATIVIPGFRNALLSFLNKKLALDLPLDNPWYIGVSFVLIGVAVYLYGEYHARRSKGLAAAAPSGTFVALRHQSFKPLASQLPDEAVPVRFGCRTIRHIEYDLSAFFLSGMAHPAGAVRAQASLAAQLAAVRRAEPDAAIGYYGIVHIPLQFLAGCSVSTWMEVALFELDRSTNRWRELAQGDGPDLGLTVKSVTRPAEPDAVVIRIAISYDVPMADVVDVVPGTFEGIRITIASPRIDAITHYGQVEVICTEFRQVLDDLHARLNKSKVVHVFYAGPVSLGFSLGRRISRTIHHRVIAYNYAARSTPHYAWGIEVNADDAVAPDAMVVRPGVPTGGEPKLISP